MAVVLLVEGIGIGCIFQATITALQAHCTKVQRAVVISNRNFIHALGGSIGLAVSAPIMQNKLQHHVPADSVALSQMAYHNPDLDNIGATPAQKQDILQAYAQISRAVFLVNVPFIALCLFGCILIKDRGFQRPDEADLSAHSSDQTLVHEVEANPSSSSAPGLAQDSATPSRAPSNRKSSQETERGK